MRNKAESRKSQSGQILIYTTIVVMLAALILGPLMNFIFSAHRSAQIRTQRTLELYASDAGIEDALYQIKTEKQGTALASLPFGNTSSYNTGTPAMNDRTENVTVQKVWLPDGLPGNATKNWANPAPVNIDPPSSLDTDKSDKLVVVGMLQTVQATAAADDFDHGWPGGSSGGNWTGNWTATGSASLASGGVSGNGLGFAGAAGNATRQTNIPQYMQPELKFQAKASSFGNDSASCQVSTDGGNWTTVTTWADGNDTGIYSSYDIDLYDQYGIGGGDTTSPLWLKFNANLHTSVIASDNFESNTWTGCCSWASQWTNNSGSGNPTGETAIYGNDSNGPPQQGSYSLRLRSNTGYAQRQVNLSNYAAPHLQFWAKAASFESNENAKLLLKVGSGSWTTVKTWTHGGSGNLTDDNTYHFFDIDLSQLGAGGQSSVRIAFQANMGSTTDYFYVDSISIVQSSSFNVDNVWIGYQANSDDIQIAYTDPNFDPTVGSSGINDPAYLDRIGVWMPSGCEFTGVVGNQTTVALRQYLPQQPDILPATYADGTILEWDLCANCVNLRGNSTNIAVPIVWDLTFSYSMPPTQVMQGMFIWIKAHGPGNQTYLSWDKGYEIYKAVSKAHSQILGTNTQVAAYAGQGAINKLGAASYGDYVATGAALLFDYSGDTNVKEKAVNPSDNSTWVTKNGFFYDGRDQITTIPSDAHITAAWLYWSGFMNNSDWSSFGSVPDTTVSFMYPLRYGPESFAVSSPGNLTHTVSSYAQSSEPYKESMDLLAHQPVLTLSNMRYLGEGLGTATNNNGNDSFTTLHKPILSSPAPNVKVGNQTLSQSGNYTINYTTGNVTIINDALSETVSIDYSVSGTMTLSNGTDYTINQTSGNDIRYTGFKISNNQNTLGSQITGGKLQGTVTIDYYYAKHWQTVQHAAYDRYGTALSPAQAVVPPPPDTQVGDTYACFDDVTQLLTGNGTYTGNTGDGQYAVGNVTFTTGLESGSGVGDWNQKCFAGWSLIVLYESPTQTAHQFYLYDPIHLPNYDPVTNPDACPFQVALDSQKTFNLTDFYPPAGTVSGRLTYFVGEGDPGLKGDSVGFKGVSQTSYTPLHDPNSTDPNDDPNNVMNSKSSNGDMGIDIDTYNILAQVGNDTAANVQLSTTDDRWYLTYMILSFKTNVVPPPDYSFNVASITYQYQLGGK